MSIAWLNRVFERSKARGAARLALVSLADRANDAGECWPAVADVARRAGLGERQARAALRSLEKLGELVVERRGGRHRPNVYKLKLDADGDAETRRTGAAFPKTETRQSCTTNAAVSGGNPAISDAKPGHRSPPNPQKPPVEPERSQNTNSVPRTEPEALLRPRLVRTDPERDRYAALLRDAARRNGRGAYKVGSVALAELAVERPALIPRRRIADSDQRESVELLRAAGVAPDDAADLAQTFPTALLSEAVARLRARRGPAPVRNLGGWLRRVAERGYAQQIAAQPESLTRQRQP